MKEYLSILIVIFSFAWLLLTFCNFAFAREQSNSMKKQPAVKQNALQRRNEVKPKPDAVSSQPGLNKPSAAETDSVSIPPKFPEKKSVKSIPDKVKPDPKPKLTEAEQKKLKWFGNILETIISGLMYILVGSLIGVIVLIILKWFFLERRIEKD